MKKTDLLKQIAKAIATSAKGVDPKVKVVGSKVVAGLGAAKLADDLILDKVPGIKNAMIWTDEKITQGQQWLVDNTLGKIPGVGPLISSLHKKGTDIRHKVRDALFGKNDPVWYEHLPQHVPFTIPGSYNNKVIKFQTSSITQTTIPSVATFNLVRNIVTTPYATTSRYSEIYTAVKYARGLSYLPYSVDQLAMTLEIGNELAVLYYRITKAVSAAFHFSLTKANLPDALLAGLGLRDVVDNYAGYCTLLDQMYNYMSVNTPLLPIMHSKLRQMCLFTALDSQSPAMSTYLQARVYNNDIKLGKNGKGFYSDSVEVINNLSDCRRVFEGYLAMLSDSTDSTSQFLNVIADVKGSIASVAYVDNWRGIKFENTFTKDETFLNSLKNADLVPTIGLVCKLGETPFGYVCNEFVNSSQGTYDNPILISQGKSQSVTLRFRSANKGTENETPTYVCCSGSKDIKTFAKNIAQQITPYSFDLTADEYSNNNRLVSLDGTENTEGKILEVLSLNAITKSCSVEAPTVNTSCYANVVVDPSLFVCISIRIANDYDNGEATAIRNFMSIPGWGDLTTECNLITSWTMIDWMPCIRVCTFHSASTYDISNLWDINGIGQLSSTSVATAIDYITYSLLYPGDVEALNKVELANKLIDSLKVK